MKDYISKKNVITSELEKLEQVLVYNTTRLSDFSKRITDINADINQINTQTHDYTDKITKLEKTNNAQKVAIQNLVKAKNTLFDRLYRLELKLEDLNQQENKEM
jgi:chromosome segregation ATPase